MGRRTVMTAAVGVALITTLTTAIGTTVSQPATGLGKTFEPGSALASGVDQDGMDRSVSPSDSLYQYVNGGWMHDTDIPPDRTEVGTFSDLRVHVEEQLRGVVEDAKAHPDNATAQKLGDFYESCVNTQRRDELKATPLNVDFAAIDKLATPADLTSYLGTLQRFDPADPIAVDLRPQVNDNLKNTLVVSQGPLTLPDRDYYLGQDPKNSGVRAAYTDYAAQMLTMAGRPDGKVAAAGALDLETRLARAQSGAAQNRDASNANNKLPFAAAQARTGLDWQAYFLAFGMDNAHEVIVNNPGYLSAVGSLIHTVPLATWKQYLRWHVVSTFAPYLSSDFVDTQFAFNSRVLGGPERNREQWRQGIACVNAGMGEALGEIFAKRYFDVETQKRVVAMVNNEIAGFKSAIDAADWMSPATKNEAKNKLSKMVIKIGVPHWWRDWSLLEIHPDDVVGNLRRAGDLESRRFNEKVGDADKVGGWTSITPQTVNASYDAARNEVTLPAAILQPPLFDEHADDAVNYGALGAVIAHEISHTFDDVGRQWDSQGNVRDWWAPADEAAYSKKEQALVERFNAFMPLPGTRVNGQLTLAENIADLSGLSVAYRSFHNQQDAPDSLGGGKSPEIDGFTGDQRFFYGYARLWRTKGRDSALRQNLRTDPHSPGQLRSDAVVNNLDGFYAAFDVKPGAPAYLTPEQRIRTW